MAASRRLEVIISGDAKGAKGALDDVEGATGRLGSKMSSIFAGVGLAAGSMLAELPGQAIGFFKGAIDAASDLGETVSKNQTIFGAAANDLMAWADDAPKALGMTKQAALDATGGLGNLFTQLGITSDQARKMSQSNVQLAADFASFHNADPSEVLESISAAYRGEYDALQKYVPVINAAKVEEAALAMTHKKSAKELTEKDKALAVDKLMMDGAGKAAGDFARTSGSAANQSKIAGAAFADLQVKIGNMLLPAWSALLSFVTGSFLPAMTGVVSWLQDSLAPVFEEIWGGIQAFGAAWQAFDGDVTSSGFPGFMEQLAFVARTAFEAVAAALHAAWDFIPVATSWLGEHKEIVIGVAGAVGVLLVAAMVSYTASAVAAAAATIAATWPLVLIVAAIAALIAGLVWAYNNWSWFHDLINTTVQWLVANVPPAWEAIRNAVAVAVQWLVVNVPPIWEAIRASVAVAVDWIANVAMPWLRGAFGSFIGFLQNTLLPAVQMVWSGIQIAVGWAANVIMPIVSFLVGFISDNFGHLLEIVRIIWDWIINVITNAWQIISNIVQFWLNVVSGNWGGAWGNICNVLSAVWNIIQNTVANGVGLIREIIQGLAAWIGSAGGRLFEGLGTGFKNVLNWIIDRWNGLQFSTPNIPGTDWGGQNIRAPQVQRLHSGGIFYAPGGGEGLALLRDRERILPPGQVAPAPWVPPAQPQQVTNEYHFHNDGGVLVHDDASYGRYVVGALKEFVDRGGRIPASVLAGS